jgi:hypothetical protein
MPYGSILDSGYFVATGSTLYVNALQGASWLKVINYTNAGLTPATVPIWQIGDGLEFNWQAGMLPDDCTVLMRSLLVGAGSVTYSTARALAVPGITLINNLNSSPLPAATANAGITAIGAGPAPLVSSAFVWPTSLTGAAANVPGDIVRLYYTLGALQLGAIDFTVNTVIADTSFHLAYMPTIIATAALGAQAFWRKVPYDPYFYPSHRYISAIEISPTNPQQTIVTLTVTHKYEVGQTVRFIIPKAYGMTQLSEIQPAATIVAIGEADANGFTNTITINVPVGSFTPFVFPLSTAYPFTPAMVVPVGMNEAEALHPVPPMPPFPPLNDLTDATRNTAMNLLALSAGQSSPAGIAGNLIFWQLGTSYTL